jgi:catechol 2,3-dioxygenase-like lactoylglutathione lyase family enzyme
MLHHIAMTASDLVAASLFYDSLLQIAGYERHFTHETVCAWAGSGPEILVYAAKPGLKGRPHEMYSPGFHHIALQLRQRADVDRAYEIARELGAEILDAPRDYPEYSASYYATYLLDLDGMKLEFMFTE